MGHSSKAPTREHPCDQVFSKRQQQKTATKCVTMRLQLWSWTTGPACARLDLPETMPQGPSSPPSLAVPVTRVSWLAWDRMQKEITALAPSTMKIKIIAPPERK